MLAYCCLQSTTCFFRLTFAREPQLCLLGFVIRTRYAVDVLNNSCSS